ncbi:hypothetical protein RVR_24 [Actinacidiphila reveromycinica]|uniref:Uncharacterized protein n=1 Tax=Actinacidiphila reveromycinica TaxID=659352 RepID=A0A7U3UME8_9ACTN|nr:hypothetical protein [Streptomyces sp. SN-593]BBA95242.1 hypothetical protein RVR_24 [Streptomyces sp. SN-593]
MRRPYHFTALTAAAVLAGGLALTAAPQADAATSTTCSVGLTQLGGGMPPASFQTQTSLCPGWADSGPNYTFHITTMQVEVWLNNRWVADGTVSNVTTACTTIRVTGTTIGATGCTNLSS